jgi:hypothetical protein
MAYRNKIILYIILISAVIVLIGTAGGIVFIQNSMDTLIQSDLEVVAGVVDRYVSAEIDVLKASAAKAGRFMTNTRGAVLLDQLRVQFDLFPDFLSLTAYSPLGEVASFGEGKPPDGFLDTQFFREVLGGRTLVTSSIKDDKGDLSFFICAPIDESQALAARISGTFFYEKLQNIKVWETGNINMVDNV